MSSSSYIMITLPHSHLQSFFVPITTSFEVSHRNLHSVVPFNRAVSRPSNGSTCLHPTPSQVTLCPHTSGYSQQPSYKRIHLQCAHSMPCGQVDVRSCSLQVHSESCISMVWRTRIRSLQISSFLLTAVAYPSSTSTDQDASKALNTCFMILLVRVLPDILHLKLRLVTASTARSARTCGAV